MPPPVGGGGGGGCGGGGGGGVGGVYRVSKNTPRKKNTNFNPHKFILISPLSVGSALLGNS